MFGFGLKLLAQLVKVELLLAKAQSLTISLENAKRVCLGVDTCLKAANFSLIDKVANISHTKSAI